MPKSLEHRISDRVTRLNGGYVTGARYNLTFLNYSIHYFVSFV